MPEITFGKVDATWEQYGLTQAPILINLIPRILASQISYTREKPQLSNHKLCSLLRAYAQKHPWVSLQGCPYFAKTERIDLYATPKPPAR
ncbi:MAG: hypothetical protein QW175_04360 [Candidatus Bathyarchaeia archaeon]